MTDSTQAWQAVPARVRELFIKYAYDAGQLIRGPSNHKYGWVLETGEVGPVMVKYAEIESPVALPAAINASGAQQASAGIGPALGNAWRSAQGAVGGPNPLTAMLLGGALAGGLGGGAGWLLHKLFPGSFSDRAPLAMGILGGLGGVGANALVHGYPAIKHQGIKGLWTQQPLQGGAPYEDTAGIDPELYSGAADFRRTAAGYKWDGKTQRWNRPDGTSTGKYGPLPAPIPKMGSDSRFDDVLEKTAAEVGVQCPQEDYEKHADAGGYLPSIPTNAWGQVVFHDPYLDNTEKALVAGLPAAAGAMRGSDIVSPRDVAKVAVNAGLGYGYGSIGGLAAKFMGLTPRIQKGLQRAGLLAGAIRGITGMR